MNKCCDFCNQPKTLKVYGYKSKMVPVGRLVKVNLCSKCKKDKNVIELGGK